MNGKFEDKLTRLAFGEMSAEEAARLETQAKTDPAAARRLAEYRLMRSDLQALKEVPEDQLSKERLRHAILNQGLRPEPTSGGGNRGWLWMPALACALTFAYAAMTRTHTNVEPTIVAEKSPAASQPSLTLPSSEGSLVAMNPSVDRVDQILRRAADVMQVRDAAQQVVSASVESRPRRQRPAKKSLVNADDPNLKIAGISPEQLVMGDPREKGGSTPTAGPSSGGANANPPVDDAPSPIVLIERPKDESGNTAKATEMESASNVLVGG